MFMLFIWGFYKEGSSYCINKTIQNETSSKMLILINEMQLLLQQICSFVHEVCFAMSMQHTLLQ